MRNSNHTLITTSYHSQWPSLEPLHQPTYASEIVLAPKINLSLGNMIVVMDSQNNDLFPIQIREEEKNNPLNDTDE